MCEKKRRKTITAMLLKVVLVISALAAVVSTEENDQWAQYSTEVSVFVNGEPVENVQETVKVTTEVTTVTFEDSEPTTLNPVDADEEKNKNVIKYESEDRKWPDKNHKPFLYGRKFQLAKDSEKKEANVLYSPLISSPIRTLSVTSIEEARKKAEEDAELLKQNQNEIFSSIRDFLSESTKGQFNETYFSEEVKESENHGGELTNENVTAVVENESEEAVSRSRQDADRSLMVVLPFKANDENIHELLTKRPYVKLIDDSEQDGETQVEGTTNPSNVREKEIFLSTQPPTLTTRKRWRPSNRFRTTTEPQTTTENGEDITKAYTNYNDVEMVTKRYNNPPLDSYNFTNHKYEDKVTPYPVYKWLKNKTKLAEEIKTSQVESTTESVQIVTDTLKSKRKGTRRKTTSTESPPKPEDLSKVMEILPPDMKDLLQQIGLNKENNEEKDHQASEATFQLEKVLHPTIDPASFSVFKPLPIEQKDQNRNFVRDDMKSFLASFGLLPTGKRVQKSLKQQPEKKSIQDISDDGLAFLPSDLKSVLEDMGLVKQSNKKEPTRIHIFNPSNHSIGSDEDFEKLNAILSSIKTTVNDSQSVTPEMQTEIIEKIKELNDLRYNTANLTDTNNEIKNIVVNKVSGESKPRTTKRATKLDDGPDPLMFSDESLSKNDVKRQVGATSSASSSSSSSSSSGDGSSSASSSSSSSSSADGSSSSSASASASSDAESTLTTTTEESPNIEALKESFGGGETASDDADVESSLPPKRPNGLYLLLDWNSFLEVGTEDDDRRVNLRFQPKIGDSRNFLPVSVP